MKAPAPAAPGNGRPESWVVLARGVFGLALLWAALLGSRLPGSFPIAAYAFGPILLTLLALVVLVVGAVACVRRPPLDGRRWRAFFLLALIIGGTNLPFPFPSRHERNPSAVPYRLPVDGEWTVVWGGSDLDRNLPARLRADRRFGLDLVRVVDGGPAAGASALADHPAYGATVRAPAAGRVVAIHDSEPEAAPGERRGGLEPGNHVVLATAPDEFVFLAPLAAGSAEVEVGDDVAAGAPLGRLGHAGRNPFVDEPHLTIHVQDTPEAFWGQAIPWKLHAVSLNGRWTARVEPKGGVGASGEYVGDRVANQDAAPSGRTGG